ncbi:MAG: cell division protein ZapA [Thermodesulfobacteria bacterium]|nr:cell division protein ZapA [Thermodesulfobacteriota bacterium]
MLDGGRGEVVFEFLGQRFVFRSNVSQEEAREVIRYLEERKREIEEYRNVPGFKLAVWLLLQVAYDYIKLKKEKEQLEELLRGQVAKLGQFLEEENILGCSWKE